MKVKLLRDLIRSLRQQVDETKPCKYKLPKDPDYFCKYQANIYREKLGEKDPCELCGRLQTLKHMKEHQKKPTCVRNRIANSNV